MLRVGSQLGKVSRIGRLGRTVGSFDLIMSILLKLTSLAIRTVAKPIAVSKKE